MPDELRDGAGLPPEPPPAAPPPVGAPPTVASSDTGAGAPAAPQDPAGGGRALRRPSWLRAALVSLAVLAAGAALGAAAHRAEHAAFVRTATAESTGEGWRLTSRRELSGLGLSGTHLIWQDGASIEYMDLERGKVLLLGPGPGMRTTWDPAVGERYAVWFEGERTQTVAAQAVAYDTRTGRRWVRGPVGSVYSYPAVSGDLAVWSSALDLGQPAIWSQRIVGDEPPARVATGSGAPVVSGTLIAWAHGMKGPFSAKELATQTSWKVTEGLAAGELTGLALDGRTLVWGQAGEAGSSGVVVACDVDAGEPRTVAAGVTGLEGPAYDGRTVVWGESTAAGGRVVARRLGDGEQFLVAEAGGPVAEVAVSGDTVAWIERGKDGLWSIVVARLPR